MTQLVWVGGIIRNFLGGSMNDNAESYCVKGT